MEGISINNWLISRILLPTAYAFPHLSTIVATLRVRSVPHRLRVPSLVDYRRHSPSSFSPPPLTRSLTCRLSSPLSEFVQSPTAYAFPHLSTIVATLRVRSVPHRIYTLDIDAVYGMQDLVNLRILKRFHNALRTSILNHPLNRTTGRRNNFTAYGRIRIILHNLLDNHCLLSS